MTDPASFRAQFPVLARSAYLNAGTEGPVPEAARQAVHARVDRDATAGRIGREYFNEVLSLAERARAGYAAVLGAEPADLALTGSTTDGLNTVLGGLRLKAGDEILTTDQEHPGLLGPLRLARERSGVSIRVVPFAEIAGEVGPATRLVACSHVSWVNGSVIDTDALRSTGVPFLLDAAQALGAIAVDVKALGCDFYAASGQKWLCGPEGSGCLYVRADRLDQLEPPWPSFGTLADHDNALQSGLAAGVKRLDHGFPSGIRNAWALASLEVLQAAGWAWVHARAATLAEQLATLLRERGLQVAPRGRSTLVAWTVADAAADVKRLAALGFQVRSIPIGRLLRASVGAWNSEDEVQRLADLASV
ncbi:MAG: aminotransferase class V-fold PLP-dependent enzyme [Solirubrobacteraceae bacterium]